MKLLLLGMDKRYQKILDEYQTIQKKLVSTTEPDKLRVLGKKKAELSPIVEKVRELEKIKKQIVENQMLLERDSDSEIRQIAREEIESLDSKLLTLNSELDQALLPKDPMDEKDVLMELRAAAGGDESGLFAAELFRMYQKYAEQQGWRSRLISSHRTDLGGLKEVIFEITGETVYSKLKYESGVHRVQRVPETEKSGRVHTSTVTVAVLPKLEELDFKIDPKDLKIETSTAQGAGGQSVNTTYSAVRVIHIPTGITAQSQDERSQQQNRQKALEVIRARVFEHERSIRQRETRERRHSQIGTGDRSEKIRTYNFPQDRITDHRINQNWSQIELILNGELDQVIKTLMKEDQKRILENQK